MKSKYWKHLLHIAISFGVLPSGGIILLMIGEPVLDHISLEIYAVLIFLYAVAAVSLAVLIHTLLRNSKGSTKQDINGIMLRWYATTPHPLILVETRDGKAPEIQNES